MAIQKVKTLESINANDFEREQVLMRKPVVIRDLFYDQRQVFGNCDALCKLVGDEPVVVNQNYYDAFKGSFAQYSCTIADYFHECQENLDFNLLCTEQRFSERMRKLFPIPQIVQKNMLSDAEQFMFLGYQGAFAPLHFDWDMHHVLLTQVVGEKLVVLFEPRYAKRLFPVMNTSIISLFTLDESERKEFISYGHGYEAVLKPGDTIFIPKLWWHALKYLSTGMSINVRFGRSQAEQTLAELPRSYYLQNIAYDLFNDASQYSERDDIIKEIVHTFHHEYASPQQRYESMRSLYQDMYARVCRNAIQSVYTGENFDIERSLGREEIAQAYDVASSSLNKGRA